MDGQAEFEELHHNPMWEMFLSDPQIERGFWEAVSAGPMAMIQPQPPSHRTVAVFFMDTADGSLFIEQSDQLPPIKAPSGKDGVRAFVFSCGDCGDASQQFIGWLETYTHEAKKAIETPADPKTGMDNYEVVENGHMVASPESKQWVKANSEAGFKIMDSIMNRCKDGAPKPCFPGR
jgi:hypothetical protein